MRQKTKLYLLTALVALVGMGMFLSACNKADDNSSPTMSSSLPEAPVVSGNPAPATPTKTVDGTSGVCAGKEVHMTPNGALGYCILDTNLVRGQCGQYVDPDVTDRVYVKIGIVAPNGGYTRTAIYHDPQTSKNKYDCGATQSNPGADPENNAKAFKDGDTLEVWRPVARDACGRDQWDGDLRDGANRIDFLGYVLNYPKDCVSCDLVNPALDCKPRMVESNGISETFPAQCSGSWTNGGTGTLDWGDGTSKGVANPFSENHNYAMGDEGVTRTVTLNVKVEDLLCPATSTIKVPPRNKSCDDLTLTFEEYQPLAKSVAAITKYFKGSFSAGTAAVNYGDGSPQQPVPGSPFQVNHEYVQTGVEQTLTATMNVSYEGLTCPKSVEVKIPPKDQTCEDYQAPVITGDINSLVQTTQVVFDQGTVGPAGGTFNPMLPKAVLRPNAGQPAGSFTTTYTLPYGPAELQCSVSKPFTKEVPPKDDTCEDYNPPVFGGALALTGQTTTQVTVTSGTVSPAGGSFNPSLPSVQGRPPYGDGDATFSTDYTVGYGPPELKCTASKTYSIKIPQQECVNVQTGTVTVKADTHESGEYAYRVCTEIYTSGVRRNQCNSSSIVWQDWIAKGGTAQFSYPPNGNRLYVQVNYDRRDGGEENPDGAWEGSSESVKAECPEFRANWNEDISYTCHNSCELK